MSLQRGLISQINEHLSGPEILLIIGPRQVGKTTILHQIEAGIKRPDFDSWFLNLEDPDYLALLDKSPKNLFQIFPINLDKKTFLFIDEVQYLNNPSNFLKYFFDEYKDKIKILASGSSAFYLDKKFKDSLAGRKKIFTLLTLSFREFLNFKGEAELSQKELGKLTVSEKEKAQILYLEYITYGGYPRVVLSKPEDKIEVLRDLAYSYIKKDIFDANIRQDDVFYKLLRILAGQVGDLTNTFELSRTLEVSKTSIDNYLHIMQKSFHISLVKPYFKSVRKELTKMPKVYFIDLGLRNFFKNDFRTFLERDDNGHLLENAVFRQLMDKFNNDIECIKFWRTADQKEVDFVIEPEKTALEVKVQPGNVREGHYKLFRENYPEFNFRFVSLADAWQIE